jgi:hypothetical protein
MGVAGDQGEAPESLQGGMTQHRLHQPPAQPPALIGVEYVDIAEVGVGRPVGNDPGQSDLRVTFIEPEAEGARGRVFDELQPSSLGRGTLYYRDTGAGRPPPPARYADVTPESEGFRKLRHDLSNPLSALLAETQLLLLNESKLDPETLTSLREIEALAVRMRGILREN